MPCPRCHREPPIDAEFCPACGYRVLVASSPRSYTPKHLAEKILTSRSAVQGERKQVTVLFADVSGFTGLSERLDPEEVHWLMNEAFELMLAEVHRYEGTVNQFLGDGIMALFGAPIGHEDHAARAVQAALGIRKALDGFPGDGRPITLAVRQGVNTGLVVVGSIGNDLRMDYTAVGDTTNVAARLQQSAEPGHIVIAEATHRLVGALVHTRPLGRLALKGKTEMITAWEVIGRRPSRTRLEMRAEQGLTPFVGREQECRALLECFEKVSAGHGQIVFVTGEAGIGKSRLLYEFRRRLGNDCTWLEGHCVSFGRSNAFHPVIDLLKRNFRIEDGDAEETIVKKVERGVLALGEDLRAILPYLYSLLSVDPGDHAVRTMEPRQRRGEIFNALRRLTQRASEVRPQVLVLEDLHWMDGATEQFLQFIADTLPPSRVLCLLTYRTGYAPPLQERNSYTRIGLGALSTDDSADMAGAVLGTERLPDELETLIMTKAEGNPFFVEEVIKSLRELGVIQPVGSRYGLVKPADEISVPDTIQDVITARVDRLDEWAKRTLQTAAVIGREFSLAVLRQTMPGMDDRLTTQVEELERLEFIQQTRPVPDPVYRFGHSLTQEVTYEELLVQRRRELHGIVARVIETGPGDRLAEQYPVLAHHYSRAQDAAKSVEYLVKAGDRAVALYANGDAVGYYTEALAQLDKQPPSTTGTEQRIDVVMRLCGVSGSSVDFERDLRNLSAARGLARQIGDRRRESQVLYWTGRTHYLTGRPALGTEYGEQALALADALGDESLAAMPVNLLGRLYFLQSQFEKNVRMLGRSAALFERDGNRIELATARGGLGWSLAVIGEFDRALEEAERSVALAQEIGHLPTEAACYMYRACSRFPRADWRPAIEDVRRSLAIAERIGDAFRLYLTTGFLGGFLVMCGEVDEGVTRLDQAVEAAERLRTKQGLGSFRVFLAEAALRRGDVAEAERQCHAGLTIATGQGDRWCEAWARRVVGESLCLTEPPMLERAEEAILEAIRIQREIGTRPDLARSLWTHARLLELGDNRERARAVGMEGARMFREMGMVWDLVRAERERWRGRGIMSR